MRSNEVDILTLYIHGDGCISHIPKLAKGYLQRRPPIPRTGGGGGRTAVHAHRIFRQIMAFTDNTSFITLAYA